MGHTQLLGNGFKIDLLTEDNYDIWKIKVEGFLIKTDLWKYVDGDFSSKPLRNEKNDFAVWEQKNNHAKSTITSFITESILKKLDLAPSLSASEAWEKIKTVVGSKSKFNKSSLFEQLFALSQIPEDFDIKPALINFYDILDKLYDCGVDLYKNKFIVSNILVSILPKNFKKFKLEILSKDELPDVTHLGIEILKYYEENESSDEEIDQDEDEDEEIDQDEDEDEKEDEDKDEEKEINNDNSANNNKIENADNLNAYVSSTENENEKNNYDDSGFNESVYQAVSKNLLYDLLNREEYKCKNNDRETMYLYSEPFNQNENNLSHKNEDDRKYLQSLLKGDKKTNSKNKSTTGSTSDEPKRRYTCSVCGQEGHNKRTCQLKSSSAAESSANLTTPSKRTYKCGVCGDEGHNKTTCPQNSSKSSSMSTSTSSEIPKKTYTCGICGKSGHNRTTCPENGPVAIATSTPKRTYTCGNCGKEGHNRTSCPQNFPITTLSSNSTERTYSCGLCGGQGHNRTICALNVLSSSSRGVSPYEYSVSSSSDGGGRSYSCGLCGGQGHNRRTCSLNNSSPTPSFSYSSSRASSSFSSSGSGKRSYSCGTCGGQGHNSRTCSYR